MLPNVLGVGIVKVIIVLWKFVLKLRLLLVVVVVHGLLLLIVLPPGNLVMVVVLMIGVEYQRVIRWMEGGVDGVVGVVVVAVHKQALGLVLILTHHVEEPIAQGTIQKLKVVG